MADTSEREPFGNGKRTLEMVSQQAAADMRVFVLERMLELYNPWFYIPSFPPKQKQK